MTYTTIISPTTTTAYPLPPSLVPTASTQPTTLYPSVLPATTTATMAYPMMPYATPYGLVGTTATGQPVATMQPLPMPAALGLDSAYFNQQIVAPIVQTVEKVPEAVKGIGPAIGAAIAGTGAMFVNAMDGMNLQKNLNLSALNKAGNGLRQLNPTKGWMTHINLPMVAAVSGVGALVGYFHKTIENDAKKVAEAAKQEESVITTGFNHFTHALAGATGQ
jgi:hypothetical protein